MKEFDEIDELFGSAFSDFEVTPPADLKSLIDEKLFSGRKPFGIWYYGLSTLLLVVFLGVNIAAKLKFREETSDQIATLDKVNNAVQVEIDLTETAVDLSNTREENGDESDHQFSGKVQRYSTKQGNVTHDTTVQDGQQKIHLKKERGSEVFRFKKKSIGDVQRKKSFSQTPISGSNSAGTSHTAISEEQSVVVRDTKVADGITGISEATQIKIQQKENDPVSSAVVKNEDTTFIPDPSDNALPTLTANKVPKPFIQLYTFAGYGSAGLSGASQTARLQADQPTFELGAEFNYSMSERLGLTSGISYTTYSERFGEQQIVLDSTFTGNFSEVIYFDSVNQVDDTLYIPIYDVTQMETWNEQKVSVSGIMIPVMVSWVLNRESRYEISITGGVRFHYNSMRVLSGDNFGYTSSVNSFGISAMIRPEFVYTFGKFGVGVYAGYDRYFTVPVNYNGLDSRRQSFGGGLLLRYRF